MLQSNSFKGSPTFLFSCLTLIYGTITLFTLLLSQQFVDDAFFTFRIAQNFLDGNGPFLNIGDNHQACTTPLYLLALFGLGKITNLPVHIVEYFIQIPSFILLGVFITLIALKNSFLRPIAFLLPALFYMQLLEITAVKGLETMLFTLFLLIIAYAEQKNWLYITGIFIGLAAATRTEGGIVGVAYFFYWFSGRLFYGKENFPVKRIASIALIAILSALPFLIFVLAYFESPLPITVQGKLTQSAVRVLPTVIDGWTHYFLFSSWPNSPLWGLLIIAGFLLVIPQAKKIKCSLKNFTGLAFLFTFLIIHGGLFILTKAPYYKWYIFPEKVILVFLFGIIFMGLFRKMQGKEPFLSSETSTEKPAAKIYFRIFAGAILVLVVFWTSIFHSLVSLDYLLKVTNKKLSALDTRGYRPTGEWLKENFGHTDWTFASPEIGILSYYSEMQCLDLSGLVSPECAPYFLVEPFSKTVMKFTPEIYVASYFPELSKNNIAYDQHLDRIFHEQYKLINSGIFDNREIRIYLRNDLANQN